MSREYWCTISVQDWSVNNKYVFALQNDSVTVSKIYDDERHFTSKYSSKIKTVFPKTVGTTERAISGVSCGQFGTVRLKVGPHL